MAQQPTPLLGPALPARPADTAGRLPVVDLRRFRGAATRAAFVTELCAAFAEHGFLYLVGHGIAPATRAGAMSASREFFALPAEAKRAVDSTLSPHVRGYSTLGRERTVGVADAREVWEMGPDADSIASHSLGALPPFMRLQGPNLWPERPVAFRPDVGRMFDEVGEVCAELLRAVATGLEQPPEHFEQYFADKKTAMKLKCCSYPPPPPVDLCTAASPVDPDSLGVGPHKDYGFLAVVDQDVAGLEVLDRQGEWQPVPLLEGALVVNSGELLELASGGAFMASTHRVIATAAGEAGELPSSRLSIGFFYNPSFHAVVRPVPVPSAMAEAARANRAVRSAAAAAGEGRDLYGEIPAAYGENALSGYMRSLPHIFETHHPDMLAAQQQSKL